MEEDYKSWEDFLDEEEEVAKEGASDQPDLEYLKDQVELPDSVKDLLEKRQQAEDHLKQLTGEAPPDPEEERQRLMYPIKVHTKETRIEERRERKEQEKKHFLKLKTLEEKIANRRVEERRHVAQQEATEARKRRERIQTAWSARQEANRLKQLQREKAKTLQEEATAEKLAAAALKKRLIEKEQRDVYEQLDQRLERARDSSFVEKSGHEKPLVDRGLDVSDGLPTLDQNKSKATKPESFDVDKVKSNRPGKPPSPDPDDLTKRKARPKKSKTDQFSVELKRNRKEKAPPKDPVRKPSVWKKDVALERQRQQEKLRKEKEKKKIAAAKEQRRQEAQRLAELESLRKQRQQGKVKKVQQAQRKQEQQRLKQLDALRKQRQSERLQREQEAKLNAQKVTEQQTEAQRIAKLEALRDERRKAKLRQANTSKTKKPVRNLQESEEQRLAKLDALRKQRQAEKLKKNKAIQPKSWKSEEVTAQKEKRWQHTEELRRARLTQLRSQQDTQRKRAQQRQAAIERLKQQKAEMEAFERKREQLRQASLRRKQGHDDMAI